MTAAITTARQPASRSLPPLASTASRTGPEHRCPACAELLGGGPVVFWCGRCRSQVMAADVDISYRPACHDAPPEGKS